jgi:hypothetical protein
MQSAVDHRSRLQRQLRLLGAQVSHHPAGAPSQESSRRRIGSMVESFQFDQNSSTAARFCNRIP